MIRYIFFDLSTNKMAIKFGITFVKRKSSVLKLVLNLPDINTLLKY